MIYQNDQKIKGYLVMLISGSSSKVAPEVPTQQINTWENHNLLNIVSNLANDIPKWSENQRLSRYVIFTSWQQIPFDIILEMVKRIKFE